MKIWKSLKVGEKMKKKVSLLLIILIMLMSLGLGSISVHAATATLLSDMNAGDIITFAGMQWIILDPATGYIILANPYGREPGIVWGDKTVFISASNDYEISDIRSYLNVDFLNDLGIGNESLIQNWIWNCGSANESYNKETEKTVQDYIGLLTYNEYKTYRGNVLPTSEGYKWWLMTPVYNGAGDRVWSVYHDGSPQTSPTASYWARVRPVLHLVPGISVLAKPAKPVLAADGTATWTEVDSENNGYSIQLYKDGIAEGAAVDIAHGAALSYDFSGSMTAAGSYTVAVTAKGAGLYLNSTPSDPSEPQAVTEQLSKPSKPVLSSDRIATWTAVANENNGYSIQLYKDGVVEGAVVDIAHGAALSYDFSGNMTTAGSYAVAITAKGTGLYADSDPSDQSDPQVVVALAKPAKPVLSSNRIATWTAVANENNGYSIQLYKDGIVEGAVVDIAHGAALSYDFSGSMTTAGSYAIAVTAKGAGLYLNSTPSDQSDPQTVVALAKPAKPVLSSDRIATWTAVANENNGYSIQLYKDGVVEGAAVHIAHGADLSHDFSASMTTAGSYTVAVTAKGTGLYADSDPSDPSDPQVVVALVKPSKPVLASDGIATWTAVANENNGYSIQLYKDGTAAGAAVDIAHGADLSYDFSSSMTTAGSYTVTVTAKGTGLYADSEPSEQSDPQIVVALAKPAKPVLSSDRIATWTAVVNENNGYSIQLYKDGIAKGVAVDIAHGADLSHDFSSSMTTAGSYTVAVTAKGTGLYADSDPSDLSDPQVVVALAKPSKPVLASDGVATWATVANENNGYSIQLYKDGTAKGVAVDIAHGAALSHDFSASMTRAGSYTVAVTAKGTGLYADSDPSDLSDPQVVVAPSGGGGSSSSSKPDPTSTPEPEKNEDGSVTITVKAPEVDEATGKAKISLTTEDLENAFGKAEANQEEKKKIELSIPETKGAEGYQIELPKTALESDKKKEIEIKTDIGKVTLPGNMFANEASGDSNKISLSFKKVEKEELDTFNKIDDITKQKIGERPVIEIKRMENDQNKPWNNPNAPVKISIPYVPNPNEDTENIVVWYIDGEGNAIKVPNGRYNKETGMVEFETTHFSTYAVAYVEKTFDDLANYPWAKHQIEVLAAKGIINGTGNNNYSPGANITRADFLTLLVRTLELNSDFENNFDDVRETNYYYEAVGIAKELGITTGDGNNLFNPKANITREDMMVFIDRALRVKGLIEGEGNDSILDSYIDKPQVAAYAIDSVSILVSKEIIKGSNNMINPKGNTTRAESAVVLYRIYNIK